jgi:hypothetical protein
MASAEWLAGRKLRISSSAVQVLSAPAPIAKPYDTIA